MRKAQKDSARKESTRKPGSQKVPFINWGKIPPFTRFCLFAFVILQIFVSLAMDDHQRLVLYYTLGVVPAVYTGGMEWSWFALLAPFTSLFLHSGWMHVGFNTVTMVLAGVFFERLFGSRGAVVFFVLSGVCGSILYILLNPFSTAPLVGASGGISGLFAVVMLLLHRNAQMRGGAMQQQNIPVFIIVWIVLILVTGLIDPNTAWEAHLGGFLSGLGLYALKLKGVLRV